MACGWHVGQDGTVERMGSRRGWQSDHRIRTKGRLSRLGAFFLVLLMVALALTSCGSTTPSQTTTSGGAAKLAVATWLASKPFDPSVGAPLPTNRIVTAYGIVNGTEFNGPASTLEYLDRFLPQLQDLGRQYAAADPTHPVKLGIDLVINVIQPCYAFPKYCASWADDATLQAYVDYCKKHDLLLFFDLQLAVQPVPDAVNFILPYLTKYPFVELALDTEFHFPNTPAGYAQAAGYPCCTGSVYASDINWTIDKLAQVSLENHLPRKVLLVHEFTPVAVPDKEKIKIDPNVSLVIQADGFGAVNDKLYKYGLFLQETNMQYGGYKVFLDYTASYPGTAHDTPVQTPADVMQIFPQPLFISYE
jgi:hypothetical protein